MKLRACITALTVAMAVSFVLPTTIPVKAESAGGLFEFFKRSKQRREERRQRRLEQQRPPVVVSAAKVSAPRYYNYKPDVMKAVDLSTLAQPVELASLHPLHRPGLTEFDRSREYLDGYKLTTFPEIGEALIAHYKANPSFIWIADGQLNERAQAVLDVMSKADDVGLDPDSYRVDLPAKDDAEADRDGRRADLVRFELELSAKTLSYAMDATRGVVDPNRLSGYHDLKRKDVDLEAVLSNLAASADAGSYLFGSNPDNEQFIALKEELLRLRGLEDREIITIADGTFLKPGGESPELANIIAAIRQKGSDSLLMTHGVTFAEYEAIGGDEYTLDIVDIVKDFQKENGLAVDGIVGRNTISRMVDVSNSDKIDRVVFAMERLRWLPRDLGSRYVLINQPAYMATYMDGGEPQLSTRVVVGKKANQTSFFMDEIETVEYNPYWGVPASIIINEMLPRLRGDPSYLDRLGYELTDVRGRRVSSSSINWYGVGVNSIPVDVRQPPGRGNALGELKILFPNSHAIYMHDTPSKSLFERDSRAFSHGCVRLQDPRGMAAAVLGKSREHVAAQIAQGYNLAEELEQKMPVYVSYFTAWPDEDGTVEYFTDMYDRDEHLRKAMGRTEETRLAAG